MRTKFSGILTLLLVFVVQLGFAQEKTISGEITDNNGLPLPGVNIIVKNTSNGTQSDFDGNYTINVGVGQTIVFSYLGFVTVEKAVTASTSTMNLQMNEDSAVLDEVVVTALGIKKEKKALGYAVSTLKGETIENKPQADLVKSLNGKVSGVQITATSGAVGSATKFVIRGQSSITGSNDPLFIVDGVPFDSSTNNNEGFTGGSTVVSSRFLDLDPNNIESISILKGLSAAVLYGTGGRNGVVLITTKNGKSGNTNKKFEISVSQSTYITQIANLPDYQNEYGQGADNLPNAGYVGNWGGRFDAGLMIEHPLSADFSDVFPEYAGLMIPYEAAPNNVSDFFRTGFGSNTSIGISNASEKASFNINFSRTDEDGYIPENNLTRYNLGMGGRAKLSNKFTVEGSANYANTSVKTPPITANNGGGASIFTRLLFTPRNIDLTNLPFESPVDGSNVYYRSDQDNPYWLLKNAATLQDVSRFFGKASISYAFSDSIDLTYRFGLDTYTEKQIYQINKGGTNDLTGRKRSSTAVNFIYDHNLIFGLKSIELLPLFNLNATLGLNARRDTYDRIGHEATGQVVFNVFNDNNFSTLSEADLEYEQEKNIIGVYAEASFDYGSFIFLNVSGRNDWSSTLEQKNNSLFYPGVSLSFVPTSVKSIGSSDAIRFIKLRAGFGSSARFPDPYNTRDILDSNTNAFVDNDGNSLISNSLPSERANAALKPELIEELEVGLEGSFFKNRVSLDLTFYKRYTTDQIVDRPLAPSTGFTSTAFNIAESEQEGVEVGLNITAVKSDNFTWQINSVLSAYENSVSSLGEGIEAFAYAGFSNLGNFASEGEPLGVIKGSYAVRYDPANITEDNPLGLGVNGTLLINPTDGKVIDSGDLGLDIETIGDPNPDWNLSVVNSFTYKNLTLSGQVEYQQGGDIFSQTATQFYRRGVTTENVSNREGSNIIPGILANPNTGELLLDGSGGTIENSIQIGTNDLYFINLVDPSGQGIYDASHMRIRELSLSYNFTQKLLEKTPFGRVSLTLLGNNLYVKAFNIPDAFALDPEQLSTGSGNGAGLEFQTGPTSKTYSLAFKATF